VAGSDEVEMNSRAFWEQYFAEEWDENDGGGQTRHFMRQLLGHLPDAILDWLVERPLDVLDWGCAYGEGAALLAQALPDATVRGLDFSLTAIEEARRRHAGVEFVWTEDGTIPQQHDVIVTSNCLEHFVDPIDVLRGHLRSCRSLYIAMVPFKEAPLHEQHVAQFRLESFPEELDGWTRVAAVPVQVDNAYWRGWQLIAAYASKDALSRHPSLAPGVPSTASATTRAIAAVHRGVLDEEVRAVAQRSQLAVLTQQIGLERENTAAAAAELRAVELELREELRTAESEARRWRRQAEDRSRAVEALSEQLGESTRLLQREETSVAKPVLRRSVRLARRVGQRLSPERQQAIRSFFAPAVLRLAPRSAQAPVYARARELRKGGVTKAAAPTRSVGRLALPPSPRADALDFLFLPVIDWHFRHQRPQQLATHLADLGHRVIYLTTTFDKPRAHTAAFTLLEQVHERVQVARLICPEPHPVIYARRLDDYQAAVVAEAIRSLVVELGLERVVVVAHHPFWLDVARRLPENVLVYDLMDDHAGFDNTAPWVVDAEAELLELADLTTVTSPTLKGKVPGRNVLIRNGAEVERFATAARSRTRDQGTRLQVGYVGAIAHWFDVALVRRCAEAHPEWDFILVGATTGSDVSRLDGVDNIRLVGERPYSEVPELVAGFDVCLIPFHVIPLTAHTNPVKAYEYLAAGKPVVATAMPEVINMAPHVHVADDHDGFLAALERAASEVGDDRLAGERASWAAEQDWAHRAADVAEAVSDLYVEASVVVLCYGNLDLTRVCVESLERHTRYLRWELVLVDNASPDGTRAWLRDFARDKQHVVLVENEENLGFAAGNNAGVRASRGDIIVLLNNDTYVTDGWLHGLVRHLRDDEGIGLVGPVTNNIGNEARIDVHYTDMEEMAERAREWTSAHTSQQLSVDNVAFFCVATRRSTWQKVGELDEQFGIGFFEDDDYCRRVRDQGLRVVIAEDVFVHHHLSAAFDALGAVHKRALFERNRLLFEEKWGTSWSPHSGRATDR
jgi:GT2 family glycosyltransferase/glycosyltransferase involved in cell wall biosynthesis/SAM-dependent methyltransferase